MSFHRRSAIVLGDGGFLGRAVVRGLKQGDWFVAGIGGRPQDIGATEACADVRIDAQISREALAQAIARCPTRPIMVVYAAGSGRVSDAQERPADDFRRSVLSLIDTMEAILGLCPQARLVFASSAAVYGHSQQGPIAEDHPLDPISTYGLHKQVCEQLIGGYAKQYRLRSSIIRYFSLYGPGLRKQLVWDMCEMAAVPPHRIKLSGDGTSVRDFLHVEDAAFLAIAAGVVESPEALIVNGGSGVPRTIADVGSLIANLYGVDAPLFDSIERPLDPKWFQADIRRAGEIGFQPRRSLGEGLSQVVQWHRALRVPTTNAP